MKQFTLILLLAYTIAFDNNNNNTYELRNGNVREEYTISVPWQDFSDSVRNGKFKREVKSQILDMFMKTPMFKVRHPAADIFTLFEDQYNLPEGFKKPLDSYDFIVVGAGSAGSVLASRLSEDRNITVLLIEAGRGESFLAGVPMLTPIFQQTNYVWPYLMEHDPSICKGMEKGRCFWPRGKAVGGTSVVNYMIYTRGLKEDWDNIAADGNNGWWYDDLKSFYMKSERAYLRGRKDTQWRGTDGELSVEYPPFRSKLSKALLDAAKIFGHRRLDYNSPDAYGFDYIQATINDGRRVSSAKAFLHRKKSRKNLHVLTSCRVTKILIDSKRKTAIGVAFQHNKHNYEVIATKEVILSAGPIESPHLLMLSGVGPKSHLESLGIKVIQDLNVGETLYDHLSFSGLTFTLNTSRISLIENNIATIKNVLHYLQFGDGPISSLVGVETLGYIKTNVSKEISYPDIEIIGTCASFSTDNGNAVAKGMHMADWLYKHVYKPLEGKESFSIVMMLLHPKSKGYLKLKSKNPFDDPELYGNYLNDSIDIATMIAGIRYVINLIDTPPFQKYGAKLYEKPFPNCKQHKFNSDSYWECALRTLGTSAHHQIGTCQMGPSSDPNAVVDPQLRVYGIKKLRVIDSSIIPRTIAAHTNAPAIMIGEKGAHMIKQEWQLSD